MQEKTGPIKEWVTPMENKLQDTTYYYLFPY